MSSRAAPLPPVKVVYAADSTLDPSTAHGVHCQGTLKALRELGALGGAVYVRPHLDLLRVAPRPLWPVAFRLRCWLLALTSLPRLRGTVWTRSPLLACLAKALGSKVVYEHHGPGHPKVLVGPALYKADLVVAPSARLAPKRRGVVVLPDACEPLDGVEPVELERPALVYAGSLRPEKGVQVLLESYRRYLKGRCRLYVVHGRPRSEALRYVASADVVVVPTLPDPPQSPLKLFEAMMLGRPIVASRTPEHEAVLRDGVDALLYDPYDPRDLAEKALRLLEDRGLARRLGESARRRAWTWRDRCLRVLEALRGLHLDASPRAPSAAEGPPSEA